MSIKVIEQADGLFAVEQDDVVIASGLSNAAAWREADRAERRPNWKTSKNEWRLGSLDDGKKTPPMEKRQHKGPRKTKRQKRKMRAVAKVPGWQRYLAATKRSNKRRRPQHQFSHGAASEVRIIVKDGKPVEGGR